MTLQYDIKNENYYMSLSKDGLQTAVNTYQTELVKGFATKDNVKSLVVNTIPMGSFPTKCKKLIFKKRKWTIDSISCREVGFLNLPILKQYTRYYNYINVIKKWAKQISGEKYIIVYSLYLPFEKVVSKIKKLFPTIKIILICADLPCEYGILPNNKFKAYFYIKYGKKTLNLASVFDGYILLTEQMKYPLKIKDKPYIITEAVVRQEKMVERVDKYKDKVILYAGTLNYKYGIKNLINAFRLTESKNYKLLICGVGEAADYIKKQQEKDSRIVYLGFQSQIKVLEMERKAHLLINPRQNDGEYVKYSFPSKTVEYMKSGTPVLMFKLEGIPKCYDDYLYYFDKSDINSMSRRIVEICEKSNDELADFGAKAKLFVETQKNGDIQANKIIEFLERI